MVPPREANRLEQGPGPILVLGATGMLGRALLREARQRQLPAIGIARSGSDQDLDITNGEALGETLRRHRPSLIVNAAALADLGACERDPGAAYAVNARAVARLAEFAQEAGARLVQVSTDHFFTGHGRNRHDEACPVRLLNEYARSKYAGEAFALTKPEALVVRTNIVGFRGWGAPTFVEWILGELAAEREIGAFEDYFVSSLSVRQLARALFDLLPQKPRGILNLASREVFSKYEFIAGVRDTLAAGKGQLRAASVRALAAPPRAESLGLDVSLAESLLGRPLPTLAEVLADLADEYQESKACATTA